jgi:hypothetical protein
MEGTLPIIPRTALFSHSHLDPAADRSFFARLLLSLPIKPISRSPSSTPKRKLPSGITFPIPRTDPSSSFTQRTRPRSFRSSLPLRFSEPFLVVRSGLIQADKLDARGIPAVIERACLLDCRKLCIPSLEEHTAADASFTEATRLLSSVGTLDRLEMWQ